MIESIYTFDSVDLSIDPSNQLIVVCDIDNTILYTPIFKTYAYFHKLVKSVFPNKPQELLYSEASKLFYENKNAAYEQKSVATDYAGFQRLLTKIREKDGKMIYLTARSLSALDITKLQFQDIGLFYDEHNTYYTGNLINKGDFMEEVLEIDTKMSIIFIDDLDENLKNVLDIYPNSRCYRFIYKPNLSTNSK